MVWLKFRTYVHTCDGWMVGSRSVRYVVVAVAIRAVGFNGGDGSIR